MYVIVPEHELHMSLAATTFCSLMTGAILYFELFNEFEPDSNVCQTRNEI